MARTGGGDRNSLVAASVCGHATIAKLIRELRQNGELCQVFGFDPVKGGRAVPDRHMYARQTRGGAVEALDPERLQVRSLGRARVRVAIAMIAMQATALGWINAGKPERMRSGRLAHIPHVLALRVSIWNHDWKKH